MPNGSSDPVWGELGKIDYLLEQLARAVERGEVPRESYDRLAPRYLERRADIVAVIEARRAASVPPPPPATSPSATPPPPARAPEPVVVNWTGVLTALGSLLVIVASAIFAITTWDLFSVEFRIAFLGLLTAGFYIAGTLVRSRLDLNAGGIALIAVGSAMLLFEGWIVIDGYRLDGVWPWVGWLAVCSAVYWATEIRVAGRFFGVIGASAQIAWVWLLGQGLGWTTGPRMAAIALIAVAWTFAGKAAEEDEQLASLAEILRFAGPLAVAGTVVGVMLDLGLAPTGWDQIVAALVIGVAATVVCEIRRFHNGIAAIAYMPAFVAIMSMVDYSGVEWPHIVVLLLMAIVYFVYEYVRGGWGHGVLAVLSELLMWILLATKLEWAGDAVVVLLAVVATSWLVASWMLSAKRMQPGGYGRNLAVILAAAGYVVLSISTMAVPFVGSGVPLAATTILLRDVLVAVIVSLLWFGITLLRRESGAGVPVIVGMFYTMAALMAWVVPGWHSALYAALFVVLTGAILLAHEPLGRTLELPGTGIAFAMRALSLVIVPVAVLSSKFFFEARSWQLPVLLGVSALLWLADSITSRLARFSPAPAAAFLVFTAGTAAWWYAGTDVAVKFALAACGIAAVLALAGLLSRGRSGWSDAWPLAAAVSGSVSMLAAAGDTAMFAVALALCAIAWAATAIGVASELSAVAAFFAIGSTVFMLAHIDPAGWVIVSVLLAVGGVLLAPSVALSGDLTQRVRTSIQALAAVGWIAPAVILIWDAPSALGFSNGLHDVGEQGVVAALVGIGVYAITVSVLHRVEDLVYVGGLSFVMASWVELVAMDIEMIEYFTTPLALYLVWAGYRWARDCKVVPPVVTDIGAVIVALVPATIAAMWVGPAADAWPHLLWAMGLALLAVSLGVLLRVRAYFFGGVISLGVVAMGRSWIYLVEFWWLVLGLIGIAMLATALTWERQHQLVKIASSRVADTFKSWR